MKGEILTYARDVDRGLIFAVRVGDTVLKGENSYMVLNLELVAGWDYVNPDYSDCQGWCSADRFIEDVQLEQTVCYFVKESVTSILQEEGYLIVQNIDQIIKAVGYEG